MFNKALGYVVSVLFLISILFTSTASAQRIFVPQLPPNTGLLTETLIPKVESKKLLKVATKPVTPLIDIQNEKMTGYSFDVWEEIAKRNSYSTEWVRKEKVGELITSVESGESEVAIAAISQTSEREKQVDFSYPYLDAGLQVVTNKDKFNLQDSVDRFLKSSAFKVLQIGGLIILGVAHIYLFIMWREKKLHYRGYFANLFDAVWHTSIGLITTSPGEERPRTRAGQLLIILWLLLSLVIVSQFQAVITADLTVTQIQQSIQTVDDLNGKKVGVVENTTAQSFTDSNNITTLKYINTEELETALLDNKIEVALADAPVLQYFSSHGGVDKVVLGPVLKKENYGIIFPLNKNLRKDVNSALLEMQQDGTLDKIKTKWFGIQI
jgi:polar amino acid transport system substrate-binding protein